MLIPLDHHDNYIIEVLVEKIWVSGSISGSVHDLVRRGLIGVGIFVLGMMK